MRYPEFQELETPRLRLRKIGMDDLVDFNRFAGSEEVTKHMLFRPHKGLEESAASIEKWGARYEAGRCYHWGIALKESNRLIGMIDLLRFEEENDSCSFAYMLAEDQWGRGYMTEALKAVIDFGFSKMELQCIAADHLAENAASGGVMRKAGLVHQGITPSKYEKDGIIHDAMGYAITRSQWKKQK